MFWHPPASVTNETKMTKKVKVDNMDMETVSPPAWCKQVVRGIRAVGTTRVGDATGAGKQKSTPAFAS
jgi:hypothetical protein